jgi:ABC-type antimicrobial peptide transport system permease subunit
MGLAVSDRGARRAADMMVILLALLGAVSAVVLAVAAVSVAHAFSVTVWSRRRELAVLRALGASRGHIRALFFGQALLVGTVAGVLGGALAWVAVRLVDWLGRSRVPDFPFKPDSFFLLDARLLLGAVAVAVAACTVGAAIPILRALSKDPAEGLID